MQHSNPGAWLVEDLRGGSPDGTDYIVNIETLRFADGDGAPAAFEGQMPQTPDSLPDAIFATQDDSIVAATNLPDPSSHWDVL